jgi:hypothetical protein
VGVRIFRVWSEVWKGAGIDVEKFGFDWEKLLLASKKVKKVPIWRCWYEALRDLGYVIGTMLVLLGICWALVECEKLIGYGSLYGLTGRSGVGI